MRRAVRWMVLMMVLVGAAVPAWAAFPHAGCRSCLCQRTHCYFEVERLYDHCSVFAFTTWQFFLCETLRDFDAIGCGIEYTTCSLGGLT